MGVEVVGDAHGALAAMVCAMGEAGVVWSTWPTVNRSATRAT